MPSEELFISPATREDLELIYTWGDKEGWNPGVHDHVTNFAANPERYFVGRLGNKVVCSVAVFEYSHDVSFIGWYIVLDEYRGNGYGLQIFKHVMELVKGQNVGLDGVEAQQKNYAKLGFVKEYNNELYGGTLSEVPELTFSFRNEKFVSLDQIPVDKIAKFEFEQTGILRVKYWSAWLAQPELLSYAVVDEHDNILSTITARKTNNGSYAISHVYATEYQYVEAVLSKAFEELKASSSGPVQYHLAANDKNPKAKAIITKLKSVPIISFGRMWTQGLPKGTKLENVYFSGSPESG
ncbi:hypothetical protein K493DRAFT_362492 [Basidiobolus meristosporus CBS 931.73]|uniref:N-acetyltransferase domain-containing protein n=1 Tax=Basidiobolus meristosporus CBS 931.73 TaxID=1314790 RepID=A0A1Y1X1Q4_9FUNG|nr:hypothetical protein K493DRAFT_362492 [Basidiobolus meristosporus CBS 931.73]|eukprot:ORX79737.1 hypothetical protein K493DRAFT_362492 [Basidiobolus meristosporus CBS 931.73]